VSPITTSRTEPTETNTHEGEGELAESYAFTIAPIAILRKRMGLDVVTQLSTSVTKPGTTPPAPTTTEPTPPPVATPTPTSDALIEYNVDGINSYRKKVGLPSIARDKKIDAYALAGSVQLSKDHAAHAHIEADAKKGTLPSYGFGSGPGGENQGDPHGNPSFSGDELSAGMKSIDWALAKMYAEGPGGGHYDNMMNASIKRVGVGLYTVGGKLYMTNDFSS
jgi:uncharacterized protein YkwD